MTLDFEPWGINDTYLRLSRGRGACIVAPGGVWNGLVRLNYVIAASPGGAEPYLIFRTFDVGFDDGRFCWKGRAAPVCATPAMADLLAARGLLDEGEAERLAFGFGGGSGSRAGDEALMLRAALGGSTFTPLYRGRGMGGRPAVTAFALRTLADPDPFVLDAADGLPVLDEPARAALNREVEGQAGG